jgi:hypothetical protein
MAERKRVFAQENAETQQTEWFFTAREGVEGPFATEALAQTALERYIEYCQFDVNRVFSERNSNADRLEWFFVARSSIVGPYGSEEVAQEALADYVAVKQKERGEKPA